MGEQHKVSLVDKERDAKANTMSLMPGRYIPWLDHTGGLGVAGRHKASPQDPPCPTAAWGPRSGGRAPREWEGLPDGDRTQCRLLPRPLPLPLAHWTLGPLTPRPTSHSTLQIPLPPWPRSVQCGVHRRWPEQGQR